MVKNNEFCGLVVTVYNGIEFSGSVLERRHFICTENFIKEAREEKHRFRSTLNMYKPHYCLVCTVYHLGSIVEILVIVQLEVV